MRRLLTVLALVSLLVAGAASAPPAGADWRPLRRVTSSGALSAAPDIAASGSTVHLVWMERIDTLTWQVRYKRSMNRGQTWGPPTNLTRRAWDARHPSIAVEGSTVHVVWTDDRSGVSQVYYVRSDDGGASWTDAKRLSFVPFSSDWCDSVNPEVAASGDLVQVVWNDLCGPEIHHRRSLDAGATWSARRVISDGQIPEVATAPSLAAIVWEHFADEYVSSGPGGGKRWVNEFVVDDVIAGHGSVHVAGSRIDAVWTGQRYGNPEVMWRSSADSGATWSSLMRMTTDPRGSWSPVFVLGGSATGGTRFIGWRNLYDDGTADVMVMHHRIGSLLPWLTDRVSGGRSSHAEGPAMATAGRWLYVAFADDVSGDHEIFFRAYGF